MPDLGLIVMKIQLFKLDASAGLFIGWQLNRIDRSIKII